MKAIKSNSTMAAIEKAVAVDRVGAVLAIGFADSGVYNQFWYYETANAAQAAFAKISEADNMFLINDHTAINLNRADLITARQNDYTGKGEVAFIFSGGISRYIECADKAAAVELFNKIMKTQDTLNADDLKGGAENVD